MIFDREKAHEALRGWIGPHDFAHDGPLLDRLEKCVTLDPAQTINRDALEIILRDLIKPHHPYFHTNADIDEGIDLILALLRPDPRIAAIEALNPNAMDFGVQVWDILGNPPFHAILRGES